MAGDIPPTHEEWQMLPAHGGIMVAQFAQKMESLGILVAERIDARVRHAPRKPFYLE